MFDIDGTLVDSDEFDGALYAQAIHSVLGAPVDKTWTSYRHVTDSGILEEIIEGLDDQLRSSDIRSRVKRKFLELNASYLSRNPEVIREIPGATQLIKSLLSNPSVRVGVATGGWKETAFIKLRKIGLDPESLSIATGSDAMERTTIMQIAEERAMKRTSAVRKTYFGDGAWDKQASEELGYDFIAVGPRVEHHTAFENLSDHVAILEQLGVQHPVW